MGFLAAGHARVHHFQVVEHHFAEQGLQLPVDQHPAVLLLPVVSGRNPLFFLLTLPVFAHDGFEGFERNRGFSLSRSFIF